MKIGLSFSRCLRDIVEARVLFEDVLVIISRTDFDPHNDAHWQQIWEGYRYGGWSEAEWADAEDDTGATDVEGMYRNVAIQLYDSGKLHQPRQFGAHPSRMPYYWLECILPDAELHNNPTVKEAWNQYQVVAGLAKPTRFVYDDF